MSSLGLNLSPRMEHSLQLRIAPKMIQSMEILQLPVMALQEKIQQELDENPVLERKVLDGHETRCRGQNQEKPCPREPQPRSSK